MRTKRIAVINVVGLTKNLIGPATPQIARHCAGGAMALVRPAFPAVTCTAQSSYLTGLPPARHGIVGNGWYNREMAEVQFWKQSNHLVWGRKLWEELRERIPDFTCAKLFWWYNMYSTADYSITPRPMYPADGRKVFDIYTWPFSIRAEIKKDLGEFPFPCFWGPAAGRDTPQGKADAVSRWIADSARWIENRYRPSLSLIYLPHLDYNLQRLGTGATSIHRDLARIDEIAGGLISFFQSREVQPILLSEYGITPVSTPVCLNRLFRERGWITVKEELGRELLDCGASKVFAVADHQVAHIYLNDCSLEGAVREQVEAQPGVDRVLDAVGRREFGIDHPRAGDLIAVAKADAWFAYYYWTDDRVAPDFARTVDIHRKPGYDPVELFVNPALRFVKLKIAARLLKKRFGFRMLMDVIPLDASLVRGSHGRIPEDQGDWPVFISPDRGLLAEKSIAATDVYNLLRGHLINEPLTTDQ